MLQLNKFLLFVILSCLVFPAFACEFPFSAPGVDSLQAVLTQDENILFNMINDMRMQNKLAVIPLSPDLCKVAQTHIADLIKYRPQDKGCSLHSWSGGGKWTSCCNTKEVFGIQCMKSKPREITGYKGDGYELIYWGEDKATPLDAAALWKQVDASLDMILTRGKWSGFDWKAMGVGIREGYAILWLGDSISPNATTKPAGIAVAAKQPAAKPAPVIKTLPAEKEVVMPKTEVKPKEAAVSQATGKQSIGITGKFYIIVGSFKTADAARTEMAKIRTKGYPELFMIEGDALYRIALAVFDTKEKADLKKNELKDTFPGVWVYKK